MNLGWRNIAARIRSAAFVIACALLPVAGAAYVYACTSIIRAGL